MQSDNRIKNVSAAGKVSVVALALFILAGICHATLLCFGKDGSLMSVLKASLMPLLLLHVAGLILRDGGEKIALWAVIPSLAFYCLGDILLEMRGEGFFLGGLGAFLVGHVFLLWYFIRKSGKMGITDYALMAAAVLLSIAFTFFVSPPGVMFYCIFAYALALLLYPAIAISGLLKCATAPTEKKAWIGIMVGGLLFAGSDFLIAMAAFMSKTFPGRGPVVMLTYLLAAFLLAREAWRLSVSVRQLGKVL